MQFCEGMEGGSAWPREPAGEPACSQVGLAWPTAGGLPAAHGRLSLAWPGLKMRGRER